MMMVFRRYKIYLLDKLMKKNASVARSMIEQAKKIAIF